MIVYCCKCDTPLRQDDEIQFTATAYFRQLASRVSFSVTSPHEADKETFRHVKCPKEDLEA